jgi:hypothetical protein
MKKKYSDALSYCQSLGYNTTLAIPNSVAELNFLNANKKENYNHIVIKNYFSFSFISYLYLNINL